MRVVLRVCQVVLCSVLVWLVGAVQCLILAAATKEFLAKVCFNHFFNHTKKKLSKYSNHISIMNQSFSLSPIDRFPFFFLSPINRKPFSHIPSKFMCMKSPELNDFSIFNGRKVFFSVILLSTIAKNFWLVHSGKC